MSPDNVPQPKKKVMRLQIKPSDPLIVDRYLDVAYVTLWFIYGLWGVTTFLLGLPTITQFTPDWYQTAWSGTIGCLAISASLLAALIFFETPWMRQVTKKYLERSIVYALMAFIAVYPVLLLLRAINGDILITLGSSIITVSYLVFPALRIRILNGRIKALRGVEAANATRTR